MQSQSQSALLDEYQDFVKQTSVFLPEYAEGHVVCGLGAEAGELLGAYAKYYRGDMSAKDLEPRVIAELGDVLWYIAAICNHEGYRMVDILQKNVTKLINRMERNKLKGDGDER